MNVAEKTVSKIYAKALFETLKEGKDFEKSFKEIEEQLFALANALEKSPEFRITLLSPATSSREKQDVLSQLATKFNLHPLLDRFLKLLAQKGRMPVLRNLAEVFKLTRLQSEGGVLGTVESADELSGSEVKSLATIFSKRLDRPVEFTTSLDPELLAGLKITVDGTTYDGTLRSQLQRLREGFIYGTGTVH